MPPTQSLQPGMTGPAVEQLQKYLVQIGYMSPDDMATGPGIYGPKTTAAVAKLQQDKGVDNSTGPGYWGPKTMAVIQGAGASGKIDSNSTLSEKELADLKKSYADALAQNPDSQHLTVNNSPEAIMDAYLTGNWTGVTDAAGQPFSMADQQDALAKSEAALKPYYEAEQKKATADIESTLQNEQRSFQEYLDTSAQSFEKDKTTLDQNAADQGVLFSGGRAQKEQKLKSAYDTDLLSKQAQIGSNISNATRDYQYKYGDTNANKLSSYFNLGSQSYNPNVASGGVSTGGLSNIYNASGQGYQGTAINTAKAAAQTRAAGLLKNKGNKILSTGYQNQL